MQLSVIIPVFNEEGTLEEIIRRVNSTGLVREIVVVDDGSEDNSVKILDNLKLDNSLPLKVLYHDKNIGKGAAIRTGLSVVSSDIVLIQDADLEYDPEKNYLKILEPFNKPDTQVVYGSRNLQFNPKSSVRFYWGGVLLSWISNFLYASSITDESTCYKIFKTKLLRELNLKCNRFEFCPEVTAKVLRRKIKIHEVPIIYKPRSREEGKKIRWYDGVIAIWTLLKYRF
ncbi:glycosyltransferase family 2 protein [Bacteroidota bacterium]